MKIIAGLSPTSRLKGRTGSSDFSVSINARKRILSTVGTSTVTDKDSVYQRNTPATAANEFDAIVTNPVRNQQVQFASSNTGIFTVDSHGIITRVANGTANLIITVPGCGVRTFSITLSTSGGLTVDIFQNFVTGSFARSVRNTVDSLVSGKTASDSTQNIYSSADDAAKQYVRNTANILSGYDLTCIPVLGPHGCLITPRHVLKAKHFYEDYKGSNYGGASFGFVDSNNNYVQINSIDSIKIDNVDIEICKLETDVPSGITFAKTLPSTYAAKLPNISNGIGAITTNQFRKLGIRKWNDQEVGTGFGRVNVDINYNTWWYPIINGDSSCSVFLPNSGQLIFLLNWLFSGGGPTAIVYKTEINSTLTTLGGGYQLTEADLTAFSSY